ncbi:MAG: hypothetical protein Q8N99_03670 [Nanoarchaeota archaeon]|nr:hypothetical protein [Nanoarchaeota archaeon]
MKEKIYLLLIIISFFSFITIYELNNTTALTFFTNFNEFLSALINHVSDYRITYISNKIGLSMDDQFGQETLGNLSINLNNSSGNLGFSLDFKLPTSNLKSIRYNIKLNDDYNITNFIDPDFYYNKTIKQLLVDLLNRNIRISLVGEKSNVTISKGEGYTSDNPKYKIEYVRNTNDSLEPVLGNYNIQSTNDTNNTNTNITPVNQGNNQNTVNNNSQNTTSIIFSNNTINNTQIVFKILNPNPSNYRINLKTGELKEFSIDNEDYDTIKWYVDNKIINKVSNKYGFKSVKKGEFDLKVEIKKSTVTKSNSWIITVKEPEKKKSSKIYLYIIIFIILILLVIISIILIKRKSQTGLPEENKPFV